MACNFKGPAGSSITVYTHTSDGTPLPGTQLTLTVYNGSKAIQTESGSTGGDGKFTFPNDGSNMAGLKYKVSATYYGDTVTVECEENPHSAESGVFSLSAGQNKNVDLTISGVTVVHGGEGATATPCPTDKPNPTACPVIPKGNHSSYPPMAPGDEAGTVAGVVLSASNSKPIQGVYVAIISATGAGATGISTQCVDEPVEYSCIYTDCNGFYQFTGVNSTTEAIYRVYATDGHGNVVYSDPFKVNSGQAVKINLELGSTGGSPTVTACPTVTVEPSVTPPEGNATVPPATPTEPADVQVQTAAVGGPNLLDQIGSFIGSLIDSIIPG